MSAVIVVSREDLVTIVESAVKRALAVTATPAASDWVPSKKAPIPRTTLDNLRKKNVVRSCRVGREVFVHRGDLEEWLQEQSRVAKPEVTEVVALQEPADPFERASARARARSERRSA